MLIHGLASMVIPGHTEEEAEASGKGKCRSTRE